MHATSADERVATAVAGLEQFERRLREWYGVVLEDKDVLDIGSGQQMLQLRWFAVRNRAVGVDLDVVPQGFDVPAYVRLARGNGLRRALKTMARKLAGVDARYRAALRSRIGWTLPSVEVRQMDISRLNFPAESFDVAYCASVFHHLPDPLGALAEMRRVLRPGGIGYVTLQLYTSATGSLDPRLFGGDRGTLVDWAHLRPAHMDQVRGNAFLNRIPLEQWREMFDEGWPGSRVLLGQPDRERLEPIARALRASGELESYTIEELVTHDLTVLWRRP